jgi:hypothetical protein
VQFPREREKPHVQERAVQGRRHVPLWVPYIALMPNERLLHIRMGDLANPRFDDFPEGAEAQNRHDDEVGQQPAFGVTSTTEHFDERERQEKPKAEMNDPVEVIAVKIEPLVEPDSQWDFRIRVMNRNGMEREPHRDQHIRSIRQGKAPVRQDEGGDE